MIVILAPSVLLLLAVFAVFSVAYCRIEPDLARYERAAVQLRQRPVWARDIPLSREVETECFHMLASV